MANIVARREDDCVEAGKVGLGEVSRDIVALEQFESGQRASGRGRLARGDADRIALSLEEEGRISADESGTTDDKYFHFVSY